MKNLRNMIVIIISFSIVGCNYNNSKSSNTNSSNTSSSDPNGTYSYSSGEVFYTMTVYGNNWTGKSKMCEFCDIEYDSGIVKGTDLYDDSGYIKIGFISGNTITTSSYGSKVTLSK